MSNPPEASVSFAKSSEARKRLCKDRYTAMRNLVVAVETGSYSKAAEQLDISASALSISVTRLEQYLGVRLLHRTTRAMTLTPEGETFYALAKAIVALTRVAFADDPVDIDTTKSIE